jgi:uncharacterized membrane protein YeaQ/YmgE (transglycosylase-associated protein family)
MTLLDLLLLLVIAGLVGAAAQAMVGYSHGGCLASIGFGFVGALLGAWLARVLGLPELIAVKLGSVSLPIVWSLIGAVLLVAALSAFNRSRLRRSAI